ncbi:MAG TPA: hypothetical protein VMV76_05620 [Dehalococcoidia bacterium]|nr:hypothetical protein [Dehalococcoidia bacterium]
MKTWLIIVSVVAVLLAASTGVGFWMLADVKADLTDTQAELIVTQEKLEENFGYWWEETAGEEYWQQKVIFPQWGRKKTAEETIYDLQLRVEELEWTVQDLEWTVGDLERQISQLESTLHIHGIY